MENIGFTPADILIPKNTDLSKWSVVACDQFTSEPTYWESVTETVGDAPSTLNITLPEIYLNEDGVAGRIEQINANMKQYLKSDLFETYTNSLFYVERTLRDGGVRRGLIGAVDLEAYDYNLGSQSLIRATEGTVLDRLPPRVKVRSGASLELPHVMLLIDDVADSVFSCIEPEQLSTVYDFPLMENAGHLKGFQLDRDTVAKIQNALKALAGKKNFEKRYAVTDQQPLLFAVGDGNHSLATAKQCYENLKATLPKSEWEKHPARYALVEVVNLHDTTLQFEPIHRAVFGIDPNDLLAALDRYYNIVKVTPDAAPDHNAQRISIVQNGEAVEVEIKNPSSNIAAGSLQNFIDAYLKTHDGTVDYIHGEAVVESLSMRPDCVGFLLPAMRKDDLFKTVILDGVLPRKTFSMGHAWDKRFYMEARKIVK